MSKILARTLLVQAVSRMLCLQGMIYNVCLEWLLWSMVTSTRWIRLINCMGHSSATSVLSTFTAYKSFMSFMLQKEAFIHSTKFLSTFCLYTTRYHWKKKWSQIGSTLELFWKTAPLFKSGAVFFLDLSGAILWTWKRLHPGAISAPLFSFSDN